MAFKWVKSFVYEKYSPLSLAKASVSRINICAPTVLLLYIAAASALLYISKSVYNM